MLLLNNFVYKLKISKTTIDFCHLCITNIIFIKKKSSKTCCF